MNSPRRQLRRKLSGRTSSFSSLPSIGNNPRVSANSTATDTSSPAPPTTWRDEVTDNGLRHLCMLEPHTDGEDGEVPSLDLDETILIEQSINSVFAEDDKGTVGTTTETAIEVESIQTPSEIPTSTGPIISTLDVTGTPEDDQDQPVCLVCFEAFAEDETATGGCSTNLRTSYVFSSAIKKNKKLCIPCKCQEGKEFPEFIHQQCLLKWQNKMAKTSCPLCRQTLYDSRTIFREAFLASGDLWSTFLSKPVKEEWGVVQCSVRAVSVFGSTRLVMFSEETGKDLLEARRSSTTSFMSPEYGIYVNNERVASLSSNMMGTTWSLKSQDEDLLGIQYSVNRAWRKEPRRMRLLAPGITEDGEQVIHNCPRSHQGSLANIMASSSEVPFGLEAFQNRSPHFNEEMEAFCLNFGGRVRLASVKNFQIMHGNENPEDQESETLIQFGRVDKDIFHLDVSFPFSPLQAFGTCISSFYNKIGVE